MWVSRMKMGAAAPMIVARGRPRGLLGCQCRRRNHGHVHLVARFATKLDRAVDQREDRVIAAQSDIGAGMPFGAALADQDVPSDNALAARLLDPEAASFSVASVAGRSACFFVCHG